MLLLYYHYCYYYCQIKPSTPNCSVSSHVSRQLKFMSDLTLHRPLFSLLTLAAVTMTALCVLQFHTFSVTLSVAASLSYVCLFLVWLFGLQAAVLDSQRICTGLNDGPFNGVTNNSTN